MIEVGVLGPIAVTVDGATVDGASVAQRAVLAVLALDVGRVVAVERLIDLVWGDDPPARAVVSLRSHVSRLRSTLTPGAFRQRRRWLAGRDDGRPRRIRPAPGVRAGRRVPLPRQVDDAASVADLDAALAQWRGAPFGELTDHPLFAADAARLREVHTQALERRAAMLL